MLTLVSLLLAASLIALLSAVFGMYAKESLFLKEIDEFGTARIKDREFVEKPTKAKEIYDKNTN